MPVPGTKITQFSVGRNYFFMPAMLILLYKHPQISGRTNEDSIDNIMSTRGIEDKVLKGLLARKADLTELH